MKKLFAAGAFALLGACQMGTTTSTQVDSAPADTEAAASSAPQGQVVSAKINKPISWAVYASYRKLTVTFENGVECVAKDLPPTVWVKPGVYTGSFPDCPYDYRVEILVGTGPLPGTVDLLPGLRYQFAKYVVTVTGEGFSQTIKGS